MAYKKISNAGVRFRGGANTVRIVATGVLRKGCLQPNRYYIAARKTTGKIVIKID